VIAENLVVLAATICAGCVSYSFSVLKHLKPTGFFEFSAD